MAYSLLVSSQFSCPTLVYTMVSEDAWKIRGNSDHQASFVFLCLVFLMFSHLITAALWSPTEKGLTSSLLLVMFIVFLLLSHVVSWVRCGT